MTAIPPIGFSATCTVNDTGSQAPFSFPVDIDVPSGNVGKTDWSYMGMPTKERKFIPTLIDNESMKMNARYCKADYTRLWAMRGIEKSWVITFPDDGTGSPHTFSFAGFLSAFPMKFEMAETSMMALEVVINGAITVT